MSWFLSLRVWNGTQGIFFLLSSLDQLRALEIVMIDLDVSGGIQACIRTETHRSWSDRWQSGCRRPRTGTGGLRWQTRGWRPPQRL